MSQNLILFAVLDVPFDGTNEHGISTTSPEIISAPDGAICRTPRTEGPSDVEACDQFGDDV